MNQESYEKMRGVRENADKVRDAASKYFDDILKEAVKAAGANEGSPLYGELVKIFNQPVRRMENEGMPQEIGGIQMTLKEEIIHDVANDFANGMVEPENIEEKLKERIEAAISKRTLN